MRLNVIIGLTCLTAGVACSAQEPSDEVPPVVEFLASPGFEALDLPFSEAARVGDMIYLSGNIGVAPGTKTLVEGGIEAETRQTMENIKAVLERNGSSMDEVVKCTVMVDDMSEWEQVNSVYISFFPNHRPARSSFGADGLALGARVEIECWARV